MHLLAGKTSTSLGASKEARIHKEIIRRLCFSDPQEQMQASEKPMQSLNETWEEKLERTQEVQREREKALEELGITVEKNNVGVHTPKKVISIHSSGHFFI